MKQLENESKALAEEPLAGQVMETAFALVRAFRAEIRRRQPADLTLSQYRTLSFISRQDGASLSRVAEHLGLTLPSASKLVHDLVGDGLITRAYVADNRRVLTLALTPQGISVLALARREALAPLTRTLATLPEAEQRAILQSLPHLQQVLRQMTATPDDARRRSG